MFDMSNSEIVAARLPSPQSETGTGPGEIILTANLRGFDVGEYVVLQCLVTQQSPSAKPTEQGLAVASEQVELEIKDQRVNSGGTYFEVDIRAEVRSGSFNPQQGIIVLSQATYSWQSSLRSAPEGVARGTVSTAGWVK